ncbi:MAG: hypothetical protein ACKPKO_15595, partial [Candidatus Fonsibacter sp.]
NHQEYDEYYNRRVGMIFPVGMLLRENKRLKSQNGNDTRKRFKQVIRRHHTCAPNHWQILQYGQGHQYKVQLGIQELRLSYGQQRGQIDTAKEERVLRS